MADATEQDGNKGTPPPEKETFSREYVSELRQENKGYRLKASEMEAKAKAAEEAAKKAAEEAKAEKEQTINAANERIIRAELKAEAIKAGMIDLDGLKLADLASVKLNDAGEVEGADKLMEALKAAKPYLFKQPSTSSSKEPPPNDPPKPKDVRHMTKAEYDAFRKSELAKIGKR